MLAVATSKKYGSLGGSGGTGHEPWKFCDINFLTNHFYLTIQGLQKAHVLGSYPAQSDQGLGVGLGSGLGLGLGSGLGLCPQK